MVHPALTRPRPLAPLPALRGVEGGRETSCARGAVWPYRSVREASHWNGTVSKYRRTGWKRRRCNL